MFTPPYSFSVILAAFVAISGVAHANEDHSKKGRRALGKGHKERKRRQRAWRDQTVLLSDFY